MFSAEVFVDACRAALDDHEPVAAVRAAVLAALSEGRAAIEEVLGTEFGPAGDTLHSSPDLTVQRIFWPPGFVGWPHEHRMWAVVGVYAGEERNRFFRRVPNGLEESGGCTVREGHVLVLDHDAIHAVENPRRCWTAGLHVYGGDLTGASRSGWGPDGREVAIADGRAALAAMFQALFDLAAETNADLDGEAGFIARKALFAASEREKRYLTPLEVRQVIIDAWATGR